MIYLYREKLITLLLCMRKRLKNCPSAPAIYLNLSMKNAESQHIKVELQHKSVVKTSQSGAIKIRKLQAMARQIGG